MTSATIITITQILDTMIEKLEQRRFECSEKYHEQERIICEEGEEKGWSSQEIVNATHDLESCKAYRSVSDELIRVRSARDDFALHDFH